MMMFFEFVILGVIVLFVVQMISRHSLGAGARPAIGPSAKETLDARLARGEIGVEEYRKLRETLETSDATA